MMEAMFSFEGRLARLPYFLRTLIVLAAVIVGVFAIVLGAAVFARAQNRTGVVVAVLCALPFLGAILWSSLSLQARRIRDIGLDPAIVIGGLFLFNVADALVLTHLLPAWAHGRGTYLGQAVNLAATLALLLWPGRDDAGAPGRFVGADDVSAPSLAPPRSARAGAPPQFGRRGLR